MKKENFIPILLMILSFVFIIISFIVFVTKGKKYYFIKQKLKIGALIISFLAILNGCKKSQPEITCYDVAIINSVKIQSSDNEGFINLKLSENNILKGNISTLNTKTYSFRILTKENKEVVISENILPFDGNFDSQNELFEISISKDIKEGEYFIETFACDKSQQVQNMFSYQYVLKIEK